MHHKPQLLEFFSSTQLSDSELGHHIVGTPKKAPGFSRNLPVPSQGPPMFRPQTLHQKRLRNLRTKDQFSRGILSIWLVVYSGLMVVNSGL